MRRARSIAHVKHRLGRGLYAYGLHGESDICLLVARVEGVGPSPTPGQLEAIRARAARGYYEAVTADVRYLLERPAWQPPEPVTCFENYAEPFGLH